VSLTLTNKFNLPDVLVRAIRNDPYSRGRADISVTQLIAPPYQRNLMKTTDMVEDAADRIYSLLGTSVHSVIERAADQDDISEERFFYPVGDKIVSGAADLISGNTLYDFKVTSVWSYINGGKKEWEQQLNLLRLLAHDRGINKEDPRYTVNSLKVVAIFRDFQKIKAGRDGYPEAPAALIDIPVWDMATAARYLIDRVNAHFAADIPPCTDEERWATSPIYAVMKKGRKSALRLYGEREAAEKAAAENVKELSVEFRPQTFRRCESYCSVSHACPHYQAVPEGAF